MAKKGFLLVTMQAPAAFEEEFNDWYDTEHVPDRAAIPGVETALRYVCISGSPRYLAIYDLTTQAVLESPAYLAVSLDNLSPWSRRIGARVRIYRSAGDQVYPGNAVTRRSARVVMTRFRNVSGDAEQTIIAGMRENFENRPETIQVRVLANKTDTGFDYIGFVEARAPTSDQLDLKPFGKYADALDLVNTYSPY